MNTSRLEGAMPIQWKTDLSLGLPDLDAQHPGIDGQLALVHDSIREGRSPNISAVLDGVRRRSSRHFACEEAFRARSGYSAHAMQTSRDHPRRTAP